MASLSPPSPNDSNLSVKYGKLAAEYAKLRSQFGVVKKAVLEEKEKNAEMTEDLRKKELAARKTEAEMEAINFRNQQLTRRIQVLQDELDQKLSSSKSSSSSSSSAKDSSAAAAAAMAASENLNSVIGQELQSKIEENARLHAKLSEIDDKYEELVTSLHSRIKELESDAKKQAQAERAEDSQRKDLIQGLKVEKIELLNQIKSMEKDLIDQQDRVTVLQVQLESASAAQSSQASTTASAESSLTQEPSSQPSTIPITLGTLQKQQKMSGKIQQSKSSSNNIALTSNEMRIHSVELLSQFSESITDLVAGWSDFHTYWEHRLKDTHLDGPLTDNASRLSKMLLQNVKHLKPIEQEFQNLLSQVLARKGSDTKPILTYLSPFCKSFKDYVDYACGLEALTIACLQHESNLHSCPPTQQAKNSQLQTSLRAYNRVMVRLGGYMENLVQGQPAESIESLENITFVLSELWSGLSDLSSIYSAKAGGEDQLPTVTDQLKNTNMCIVQALASLVECVNALVRLLSDNLPRITKLIETSNDVLPSESLSGEEEEDSSNNQKTDEKDLRGANVPTPPDSAIVIAQEEVRYLESEKENLAKTIEELQEKLKKTEQNKEHWKLEFQLLQMKHDKVKSNLDHLSSTNSSGEVGSDEAPDENSRKGETDQDKLFSEREVELKKPFAQRIEELVSEKMMADSKATGFYLECVSLKKRIKSAENKKIKLEQDLASAFEQTRILREESTAVTSNYESQLSMMSEHVAVMNEKISAKSEEIETLKFELANKKGRK